MRVNRSDNKKNQNKTFSMKGRFYMKLFWISYQNECTGTVNEKRYLKSLKKILSLEIVFTQNYSEDRISGCGQERWLQRKTCFIMKRRLYKKLLWRSNHCGYTGLVEKWKVVNYEMIWIWSIVFLKFFCGDRINGIAEEQRSKTKR